MSFVGACFAAIFHVLALAWATIHPATNPHQHLLHSFATEVREGYQETRSARKVYAAARVADSGYWHTSGNLLLDRGDRPVRIEGINWYGLETVRKAPGGLMVQDYRAILETIRSKGFNTVRIPFSSEMIEHPVVPDAVSFVNEQGRPINQPLRGLTSIEILDRIVEHAGAIGLKVILDNHRSEAGDSAQGSGLWYTASYPEASWIADWQMLARRYAGNSTVIGVDLRNEPHNAAAGGACWSGCGAARDWRPAAERAGNAVLAVNPKLIVFVEGTDTVNGDWYWWGGNLQGVRTSPVRLNVPNQLVYSAHEYGPKEYAQKWFDGATSSSLMAVFERHWGFVSRQEIAPVWIGEFGTSNRSEDVTETAAGTEGQWFQALTGYLQMNREVNWTSWALNGEDSDGLLTADYAAPANELKMAALNRIMTGPVNRQEPAAAASYQVASVEAVVYPRSYAAPTVQRVGVSRGVVREAGESHAYRPHLPASVLNGQYEASNGDGPRTTAFPEADGY